MYVILPYWMLQYYNLWFPFQCYSLATIGYRVATFNDCEEASESLKQVFHLLSSYGLEFHFVEFL